MEGGSKLMSSVDNRIVKMGFDNSQFTKAANSTISTLKNLTSSLKLTEGAKGLENISSKMKSVDTSTLSNNIDTINSKFSMMDIVGVTALVRISNAAIDAGKNLVKSLTIDPIMDGYREYEVKMKAIQTIMTNTASKGTTLDDINAALADLNAYSDKTIYNFAQMTDNIGKATAAGVGLEDSVTFVKGLANVAAGFGVDAMSMAGATQQMTQALASGTIRLQDWISMENRGMGGDMLQKELIATAKSMGVYVNESIPFRYSLEDNWLSSEIFIKTMDKMANDQSLIDAATKVKTFTELIGTMQESVGSGWAVSWEHIFGNKEESTELFTSISQGFSDLVGGMSDYRNESLKTWKEAGGRTTVLTGMKNLLTAIGKVLGPIYESFKKIIDPWNSNGLLSLSDGFEKLTSRLIISDEASAAIGKTFDGLFTVLKGVLGIFKPIFQLLTGSLKLAQPLITVVLNLTASIGGVITKLGEMISKCTLMDKIAGGAAWAVNKLAGYLNDFANFTTGGLNSWLKYAEAFLNDVPGSLSKIAADIGAGFEKTKVKVNEFKAVVDEFMALHQPIEKLKKLVEPPLEAIKRLFDSLGEGVQAFGKACQKEIDGIKDFFGRIVDVVKRSDIDLMDIFNAGFFVVLFKAAVKIYKKFKDVFSDFGGFVDNTNEVLLSVKDTLEVYQKSLKAAALKEIAIAVGILAVALLILSKIEPNRLLPSLGALSGAIVALMGAMYLFSKIEMKSILSSTGTSIALVGLANALILFGVAMRIINVMDWNGIGKSLAGLAGASAILVGASFGLSKFKFSPVTAISMILLAQSLIILSGALFLISKIPADKVKNALITLAIVFTEFLIVAKLTKNSGELMKAALSLIPLATALLVLAGVLAIYGNMDVETLKQGFAVMATALFELAIFSNLVGKVKSNLITIAGGLVLLSVALGLLTIPLLVLGRMDIKTLVTGIAAIGLSIATIGIALKTFPSKNAISAGLALSVVALAMLTLTGVLVILSTVSTGGIIKSLVTLIGTLSILGVSALLMGPIAPILLTIAAGIGALGLASTLVGGSLIVLSIGITALSTSFLAAGASITGSITALCAALPVIATAVAGSIVAVITVLASSAPILVKSLTTLFIALCDVIINSIPKIAQVVLTLIRQILVVIQNAIPEIMATITNVIIEILKQLTILLPEITNFITTTIRLLFDMILTILNEYIPQILEFVTNTIIAVCEKIFELTEYIFTAIFDCIINVLTMLEEKTPEIVAKIFNIINLIIEELARGVVGFADGAIDMIVTFIETISKNTIRVTDALFNFVITITKGLTKTISERSPELRAAIGELIRTCIREIVGFAEDFVTAGKDMMLGMVKGVKKAASNVVEAAKGVASSALEGAKKLLGIHSPSRKFAEIGRYTSEGFAVGIKKYGYKVTDEVNGVGSDAISTMSRALSDIDAALNDNMSANPVITPVMDLSNIQNGANSINSLMGSSYSVDANLSSITSSRSRLADISNGISGNVTNNESTIHNTFNISGSNPREIANEVSKIIQKQVERRSVVWA